MDKSKRKNKIKSIGASLKSLKKTELISEKYHDHLKSFLTPTLIQIFDRMKQSRKGHLSRESFPEELKAFAITLQFYSTKAYEYVRKTFLKALPHVSTIRSWYSSMDGSPGLSDPALQLIRQRVEEEYHKDNKVILAIMVDDMSIKKQLEYSDKERRFKGLVDVGTGAPEDPDEVPLATDGGDTPWRCRWLRH